jgi:GNAT superfamily N-acetyltransferase
VTDLVEATELESNEAQAYARLIEQAPPELLVRHGLSCGRVAGATIFVARGLQDGLMFNRVIGLGLGAPATAEVLDAIDDEYRRAGVQTYAIEAAPSANSGGLGPLLRERGLMPFKVTAMLVRDTAAPIDAATGLHVRRVDPAEAQAFGRMAGTVFSLDEPYMSLLAASVGRDGWQHWAAFDGRTLVASAITAFTGDGRAWVGWVGTMPDYRGRGAQSALAVHQVRAAAALDVTRVSLEAAPGSRKKPSQTLANYLKLGWVQAYERPVYLRRLQA